MRPIGGYFEWEFPDEVYLIPHENEGFLVNNARSALQLILQNLEFVKRVYLPYYICDSMTLALSVTGVQYQQYHINDNLEIADKIELNEGEYIIYTNYFGIKDGYCRLLASKYGINLIVDNAQALYTAHIKGTHSIYSCRKFIGVPDGGIAISDNIKSTDHLPIAKMYNRCGALLARAEDDVITGYELFKKNDRNFREDGMAQMSLISRNILKSVDHNKIIERRRENFGYLHKFLGGCNLLPISDIDSFACPLVYPFYMEDVELRNKLISNKIFVAQYWPNVLEWCDKDTKECRLTENIIPLPIDQRYAIEDMNKIVKFII